MNRRILTVLIAFFILFQTACNTHTYQIRDMPGARDLDGLEPLAWASRVRYQVSCRRDESVRDLIGWELCQEGELEDAVGDALVAMGPGWEVVRSAAADERGTLNLHFYVMSRSEMKGRARVFSALTAILMLSVIPAVESRDFEVVVVASRGLEPLLDRQRIGDSAVRTVISLNPVAHIGGSASSSRVNRAFAADIVVSTMHRLQAVQ